MGLSAYVRWIAEFALPHWMSVGLDRRSGLFYERLTLNGQPDTDAELRVRTHFRQAYVFAHAATLGLTPADGAIGLASEAMERIDALAWGHEGRPGFVHRLSAEGKVTNPKRDLYDHAFALLALGALYRATGDARWLERIDATTAVIDTVMAAPHGGWAESDEGELPRRQNPHMHLFEASLGLFEATHDARHLARAGELYTMFSTRFFDAETAFLREFFDNRWQVDPVEGQRLDPGHMMEWAWLLRRYERATGRPVGGVCETLFASAERLGLDPRSGFLVDEVDAEGRVSTPGRRLWLQTEYLKALVVRSEALRTSEAHQAAESFADRLLEQYLSEIEPGCWRDRFDLDGRFICDHIPASTFYHLFAAAAEIMRYQAART